MSYAVVSPFSPLQIALGSVDGMSGLNKFGLTENADSATPTDIWDRATQPIWLAPTASRIHALVSTSVGDTAVGVGAQTVRVYGLRTWDAAETYEDVTMGGTVPTNTSQSYVMIHRMKVIAYGASGPNVGTITATAATDGTVTAQITPGTGQTLMAIYGVPSVTTLLLTQYHAMMERDSPTGASAHFTLLWTQDVENYPAIFIGKHTWSMSVSDPPHSHIFLPPNRFVGPGILKIQATTDANDTHIDAGFDGILVTQ